MTVLYAQIDKLIEKKTKDFSVEMRMIHKKGHFVWVKSSGKVIEWENGTPLIMIGTHIDISEIKRKQEKLQIISEAVNFSPIAVTILDEKGYIVYVNPHFSTITGYELNEVIEKKHKLFTIPEIEEKIKGVENGYKFQYEYLNKRKNDEEYWESSTISGIINEDKKLISYVVITDDITSRKQIDLAVKLKQEELEKKLNLKMFEIEEAQRASILALAILTESRDYDTGQHVERVQYLCKSLAIKLQEKDKYKNEVNREFIENIFYAASLHDIGKIKIPDRILLSEKALTKEEFKEMKNHVKYGSEALAEMVRSFSNNKKLIMATLIARYHHEKWDGSGYLEGLKGEEIPLPARIMTLVDIYDALRSKRPYKEAYSQEKAVKIINELSGTELEPDLVSAFNEISDEFNVIFESFINKKNN